MSTCSFCGDTLEPDGGECVTCALTFYDASRCRPPYHVYIGRFDVCVCGETSFPDGKEA